MGLRAVAALLAAVVGLALVPASSPAAAPVPVTSTSAPTVKGAPVFAAKLVAGEGLWSPSADLTFTYQWLRDGTPLAGATARRYRPGLDDLGHRLAVRVTATEPGGGTGTATSAETAEVARATLVARREPAVVGVLRFGRTLRADPGRWKVDPTRIRYRWLRAGREIPGASGRSHTVAPGDVGSRLRVRVTVKAPGYERTTATSPRAARVAHRVDAHRTVTYHVETRGPITTDVRTFARLAQQTYDDPRGWRGAGVRFRRVARGGDFTLVLASAGSVPAFSSVCSSMWSCRVGRYVIINQERWKHASPAWNAAGGARRGYRHMVVNHETGHWLGRGHASCTGRGDLAPVMQQQSKGLAGCRFNPWPTLRELRTTR